MPRGDRLIAGAARPPAGQAPPQLPAPPRPPQTLDLTANRLRHLEDKLLALTGLRRLCLRQNLVTSTEEVQRLASAPGGSSVRQPLMASRLSFETYETWAKGLSSAPAVAQCWQGVDLGGSPHSTPPTAQRFPP